TITVFSQGSDGEFSGAPLVLSAPAIVQPVALAAADLDGDRDIDLASANYGSHTLAVFFQTSPGVFSSEPRLLGNSSVTNHPHSVQAADLDGDGDLDLVSANFSGNSLAVFFQTSSGSFAVSPLLLTSSTGAIQGARSVAA